MDSSKVHTVDCNNGAGTHKKCPSKSPIRRNRINQRWNVRNILVGSLFLSLFIALINPSSHQQQVAEGAKLKKEGKKLLKSLVKGFVVNKLTTRKNFMPLPVPIPVPIELSEPPVYLKGKPKYVNVYKATTPAVVKPTTVYHMPVYSPTYQEYSTSMMNPMGLYGPAAYGGGAGKIYGAAAESQSMLKHSLGGGGGGDSAVESAMNSANYFNDFDDDSGNYYTRKSPSSASGKRKMAAAFAYGGDQFGRRSDHGSKQQQSSQESQVKQDSGSQIGSSLDQLPAAKPSMVSIIDEKESIDQADKSDRVSHLRLKRQIYMTSHEEGPCYGFPLEVNIKSRIKLDSVFPIHGKSQHKKCIKRPKLPHLLPPPDEEKYPRHPYK